MANFQSNSLDRHPESLPEDSHGFMNRWVSLSPTAEGKLPTVVWVSTQAPSDSMMNPEVQILMRIV